MERKNVMKKLFNFTLLQSDIDAGVRGGSCSKCPIALHLNRYVLSNYHIRVGNPSIHIYSKWGGILTELPCLGIIPPMPEELSTWIANFGIAPEFNYTPKPISFQLLLPTEYFYEIT